ncbi:hypothetical protein RO3G_03629 [Rhizopus delemar RA 99-880]|uniref:Tc1-like transposase DDE domain-containing protein n=1 Tax=Rhizopus delemar (strain RA 99-880 / ATCC MYA-4621 / FGSC 9543 / NRRL 43880) TaxID=246409 RepID=I1BRU4_RHIO9|nr:hypothetical protein RO3G_03629 [Rhizopus delemar RA 99-880]|eukprot:EIE78924.1 hypothetical protein RO3G_03629 [Rhizopus delemar RA 99-880]
MGNSNASEASFSSSFESLLAVLFQGYDISTESGGAVSESTVHAAAANDRSTSDFGRRIDILVHNSCYGIRNEYCCIEFKRQNASTELLTRQQSKSIRINGAVLDDLIAKTNADDMYLIYMDFWGVDGYIAGLKRFENINVADHISSVRLPISLVELEDFRTTVKHLYQWRQHVLNQSRKIALGVYKEKHKYEVVDISRPSTPTCHSPVPANEPLDIAALRLVDGVCIGELAFHINLSRTMAWSVKGTKAVARQPKTRAKTTTILGANCSAGIVNIKVRVLYEESSKKRKVTCEKKAKKTVGTVTGHYFNFIVSTLDVLDRHEHLKGCYLVMDNAPIHNSVQIERLVVCRGYGCVYLPPYSPELNSIEQFWSVIFKAFVVIPT